MTVNGKSYVTAANGQVQLDLAAGQFLKGLDPAGKGIELDATQISAIAAFLRVLNALVDVASDGWKDQVKALAGKVHHFFHLAAIYDMSADAASVA